MLGKNRSAYGRRLCFAAVAVAVGILAAASGQTAPAGAQVLPPSLAGEVFVAREYVPDIGNNGEVDITFACTSSAPSQMTISYTASGVATGPYPGTFRESGSITADMTTATPVPIASSGTVVSWNVNFSIDSPVGQVTGTKFVTAEFSFHNFAHCQGRDALADYEGAGAIRSLAYEATIETVTGTFIDRGESSAEVFDRTCTRLQCDFQSVEGFTEVFWTSTGVAPAPSECGGGGDDEEEGDDDGDDEDDDDGDECEDEDSDEDEDEDEDD